MTKKQKEYVILALLLLAGAFYALQTYYLQDKWSAVAAEEQQLEQQKGVLSQLQQRTLQLNGAENQKNKLKQQIAELDQGLPYAKELPGLIDFFYGLTKEYQVTGDRIQLSGDGGTPAPPSKSESSAASAPKPNTSGSPGISAVQLQITYKGDRQKILSLLQNLQREISRKITLTETDLSVEKDGKMSLSLKAAIYYQTGTPAVSDAASDGSPGKYPVGSKGFKDIKDMFSADASPNTGAIDNAVKDLSSILGHSVTWDDKTNQVTVR